MTASTTASPFLRPILALSAILAIMFIYRLPPPPLPAFLSSSGSLLQAQLGLPFFGRPIAQATVHPKAGETYKSLDKSTIEKKVEIEGGMFGNLKGAKQVGNLKALNAMKTQKGGKQRIDKEWVALPCIVHLILQAETSWRAGNGYNRPRN